MVRFGLPSKSRADTGPKTQQTHGGRRKAGPFPGRGRAHPELEAFKPYLPEPRVISEGPKLTDLLTLQVGMAARILLPSLVSWAEMKRDRRSSGSRRNLFCSPASYGSSCRLLSFLCLAQMTHRDFVKRFDELLQLPVAGNVLPFTRTKKHCEAGPFVSPVGSRSSSQQAAACRHASRRFLATCWTREACLPILQHSINHEGINASTTATQEQGAPLPGHQRTGSPGRMREMSSLKKPLCRSSV